MIQTTYKGWNVLCCGNNIDRHLIDCVIHQSGLDIIECLKSNQRSLVQLISYNDNRWVLKTPREKNRRKWIRFTTWLRKGEAFRTLLNLERLKRIGIQSNRPVLAVEKRRFGMVVDSRMVYTFCEGTPCNEAHYELVVKALSKMHAQNTLHGDPQIRNFIFNGEEILTIDSNPKRTWLGKISTCYELLYLEKSAPGISKYFEIRTRSFPFQIAKTYIDLYWWWRGFKKRLRKKRV
jgi:heptose II phosphotransferase